VASAATNDTAAPEPPLLPDGIVPLTAVVRVNGPFSSAIQRAIGSAGIAGSYDRASQASAETPLPIATLGGHLFRQPNMVTGGGPDEARGILEPKRQIKELNARIDAERSALACLADETTALEGVIARASLAIDALHAEHHKHEKAIVGFEAQLQRAADEETRL